MSLLWPVQPTLGATLWDAVVKRTMNGASAAVNLDHADVDTSLTGHAVVKNGLAMEDGGEDYTISPGTGPGGVTQILFVAIPEAGTRVVVRYMRTTA